MRAGFIILVFLSALFTTPSMKASDTLPASKMTWKEHFGTSVAETNTLFSLMAHGYFRAETTNVQEVVDRWLSDHPKATVKTVSTFGPYLAARPNSRFAYVWVVQGNDNLNVELVRRGCVALETQLLNPDEKALGPVNTTCTFWEL
jgi:hypothetical protein